MSRRKARVLALEALYAYEAAGAAPQDLLQFGWLDQEARAALTDEERAFAHILIDGALRHIRRIDGVIKNHLQNWELSRVKRVDLALLRLSAYSLLYQKEIPAQVVIDEAIEISFEYSTDDSYKFINGILDSIKAEAGP